MYKFTNCVISEIYYFLSVSRELLVTSIISYTFWKRERSPENPLKVMAPEKLFFLLILDL